MRLSRALALTHEVASATYSLDELGALLDPDLVSTALETAGVATLRKRRLPLEAMIWCVIAMALFRRMSAWDAASRMGIMLPGQKPLVAPSAIVQGRQRLGSAAVREVLFPDSTTLACQRQSPHLGRFAPAQCRWRGLAHAGYGRQPQALWQRQ